MLIERYSLYGFKPQYQSDLMHTYEFHKNNFNINDFLEHLRWIIQQNHEKLLKFYEENMDDLKSGVWVFIRGHKCNQALNHLKIKVPCWYAELPDDTVVYDCNIEKKLLLSDPLVEIFGCYVPEKELKNIRNIEKITKEKRKMIKERKLN